MHTLVFLLLFSATLAHAQDFLFDRAICTGLGDRVGTMLSLAALARHHNATVGYLWCEDPSVVYSRVSLLIPRWTGWEYNLTEFKARFRPPPEIVFVSDLTDPRLQRLPKVVWGQPHMPIPAEQGSDSIPNIGWLTMRLPLPGKLDYQDSFQAHYRGIVAPIAANQPGAIVHGPYIMLHMRGPDDNTYVDQKDSLENYCTGKVIKALRKLMPGIPVYAISNNISWAKDLLEGGRVPILEDTGSAYDHFSLLVSAKAIIQHALHGWSSYSSVPALISGAPMINTYSPALPHHRFHLFKTQRGLPSNFYDCTQIDQYTEAILHSSSSSSRRPELVAYATDRSHKELALLQRTARWHGWAALHVIGTQEGFNTHGLVDKLRALRHFARKWPADTILVFVDGYDVIVNNEPGALESAFLASGKRVLISSELGCCTDKKSLLEYGTDCHPEWPFPQTGKGRRWLNTGVIVGYAKDIRKLLRMAWKEYKIHPALYKAYTDQQLMCFLVSDGSTVWTRAAVGIDHMSEVALSTYQTDIRLDGTMLGLDAVGRIMFANRSAPAFIHFNGPSRQKGVQREYAKRHFPLIQDTTTK